MLYDLITVIANAKIKCHVRKHCTVSVMFVNVQICQAILQTVYDKSIHLAHCRFLLIN